MSDENYNWDGPRDENVFGEHEQPTGVGENDDWEFNTDCDCETCLEYHEHLDLPLEWCDCEACSNLHSEVEAPVDGCVCQNCIDLDEHLPPADELGWWPWRFNSECSCERCLDQGPDYDVEEQAYGFTAPETNAKNPSSQAVQRSSDSLFQMFLQKNARTMRKGASWSKEEDEFLLAAYFENLQISDIALRLMRTNFAIQRRLIRHLLEEKGLEVKANEGIQYLLENSPWAESDRLACQALFRSGFSPVGIASALRRHPLSIAAELIREPDLFR